MEQITTVKARLDPTPEQREALVETLVMFAAACSHIHAIVPPRITNSVRMREGRYDDIRARFKLSANLAIQAFMRVGQNRKAARALTREVVEFRPTSVAYDQRIFDLRVKDMTASLTTTRGRQRVPVVLSAYHLSRLGGRKPTSATLAKDRKGVLWLHIQVKHEAPEPTAGDEVIGVDLGRTDIAVTSNSRSWSGKQLTAVRDRYSRVRREVQTNRSKGTRSTRRRAGQLLERLSGREGRFQKHVNHTISKTIVGDAVTLNATIALEDLTGIRERTNVQPRSRTERRRSNSWAFFQLRQHVTYKAALAGVPLVLVNPAYTSQMCNRCKHIGARNGKSFRCVNDMCEWRGDADHNSSLNIALLGGALTRPCGSSPLVCELRAPEIPRLQPWEG